MNPQLTAPQAAWCLQAHLHRRYCVMLWGSHLVTGSAFTPIPATAQDPNGSCGEGASLGTGSRNYCTHVCTGGCALQGEAG